MNTLEWESLAPLLPLALLPACQLAAAWSKRQLVRAFGWWGVPLTTGWIGVPVHELSHVLAAYLLGRKVLRVHWFAPDRDNGSLGSVEWQPGTGPLAWLALLVVGVAPLVGGTLCLRGMLAGIALAVRRPLPDPPTAVDWQAWQSAGDALANWALAATATVWARPDPLAWLAVVAWWALISVASHLSPSHSDLRGAWRGGLLVAAALALAMIGCQLTGWDWRHPGLGAAVQLTWWLAPGLVLAMAGSLGMGAIATVLGLLRRRG